MFSLVLSFAPKERTYCHFPPQGRKNITQAPTITVLVIVLHYFFEILSCLHILRILNLATKVDIIF